MSLLIKGLPKFVPPVYGCWAILQAVNVAAVKPATGFCTPEPLRGDP